MKGYLTKAETAQRLGISERTLERMTKRGKKPQVRYRPRSGNRAEPMYRLKDVEELLHTDAEVVDAEVVDAVPTVPTVPTTENREVSRPTISGLDLAPVALALRAGLSELRQGFSEIAQALKRNEPDPYLTVEAAAEYKGISPGLMLLIIRAKKIPAFKYGHWHVRRSEVDRLDVAQVLEGLHAATAAIRERVSEKKRRAAGES